LPSPKTPPTSSRFNISESPAGNALLKVLIATGIVVLCIWAYVAIETQPPVATGQVIRITAYPVHTELRQGEGANGMQGGAETYDQMIVLAQVRLHNQSKGPIFVHDFWANIQTKDPATLDDEDRRSLGATATDFPKVFLVYPALQPLHLDPILRRTTIPSGQTIEGLMIFNYPVTQAVWDLRRSMDVTVAFTHQHDLVIHAPQ
jgi:hypothetical protein